MTTKYQIEKIDYDLIRKATNVDEGDKRKLFGFSGKYIAARPVEGGFRIIMETIGKRDECSHLLSKYFNLDSLELA